MSEGEDWVMRPWVAGRVDYADLVHNTRFDLADVARMNDALDVEIENIRRTREWLRNHPEEA